MLNVITWTAAGLGAGWVARRVLGGARDAGWADDLVAGAFGAVLAGWLIRRAGLVAPDGHVGHALSALLGALTLLAGLHAVRHAFTPPPSSSSAGSTVPWAGVDERLRRLGEIEQRIWRAVLTRQASTPDPNQVFDTKTTVGERLADRVAQFGGSWTFIGIFGLIVIVWMAINEDMARPFDPYPFILLNLVLSCLAALQAPVIMMSQNRQGAKDRSDAKSDYEVNLRAEMEIMSLHAKVDVLREQEWLRLVTLVEHQQTLLEQLGHRLDTMNRGRELHDR